MLKHDRSHPNPFVPPTGKRRTGLARAGGTALLVGLLGLGSLHWISLCLPSESGLSDPSSPLREWVSSKPLAVSDLGSPYGRYPLEGDPFKFIPCTNTSLPPPLDDPNASQTWSSRFDPDPTHWSWGQPVENESTSDHFVRRGIYLCGYLDLPLDYLNASDDRIVRLAVTKFQVSGLPRRDSSDESSTVGRKSDRTIILEPGGPGGSGTGEIWQTGELVSKRFSDSKFDVLGWDPRGVNISLPAMACFPDDALRDRWSLFTEHNREVSNPPINQLRIADAMNDAKFHSCRQRVGDFGRFVGTSSVARDLEEIRKALNEDQVTGYFMSYGTAIAQAYASMFPNRVGRLILDGSVDAREYKELGGFALSYFGEKTDVWRDGFLSQCISAGPEWCALAKPKSISEAPVTQAQLDARVSSLLDLLKDHPIPAYTPASGPSLVTYSALVSSLFPMMYNPSDWPATAQMLYELELGNSTLAAMHLESRWRYRTSVPPAPRPASAELPFSVICADSYDAPLPPEGLIWWDRLWETFTERSWLSGNFLFSTVFPCSNYRKHWFEPPEQYRGDFNYTLENPVLLLSVTHDPATPLRHGKKLLQDMGSNARLIVHHGFGHTSMADRSNCTDTIAKDYLLSGIIPSEPELDCYADKRPFVNYEYSKDASSINVNRWPFS